MSISNQKPVSAKTLKTVAAIFIAVCVIAFFLPVKHLVSAGGLTLKSGMFVSVFGSLFSTGADMLNFIPAVSESILGYVASIAVYGMFFGLLIFLLSSPVSSLSHFSFFPSPFSLLPLPPSAPLSSSYVSPTTFPSPIRSEKINIVSL